MEPYLLTKRLHLCIGGNISIPNKGVNAGGTRRLVIYISYKDTFGFVFLKQKIYSSGDNYYYDGVENKYRNCFEPYDYKSKDLEILRDIEIMLPYEKKINNIRIPEKSIIHYRQYGTYDKFRKVYYHEFVYDENNLSVPLSEHDIWFCKFGIEYDSGQGGLFFRTGYPQKKYEKFNQVPRINIHEYPEVNSNLIGYLEGEVTYKKVYQSAEGTFWPDFGEWYYIITSDGISGYVLANELSEGLIKGQFVEYVDEPFSNEYNDKNKDDNNALINDNDGVEDETLEDNIKNNDENRFSSLDNKVFIGISCIILIIVTILIAFLIKKKK